MANKLLPLALLTLTGCGPRLYKVCWTGPYTHDTYCGSPMRNEGQVKRHTLARLDSFVDAIKGKRITYKELIAEVV